MIDDDLSSARCWRDSLTSSHDDATRGPSVHRTDNDGGSWSSVFGVAIAFEVSAADP